jgi:hypothetical protein
MVSGHILGQIKRWDPLTFGVKYFVEIYSLT